ncbi:MAG: glycosyltransferase family 4 protein [Spirochaetaceae bacterium]|nr:glycosyltransferase family 4 protein [Spirochaetaceae bacterium]
MPRAIIVSPNGLSDSGGVERVMLYASRALSPLGFRPLVLDKARLAKSSIGRLLRPLARGRLGFTIEGLAYSLLARSLRSRGDIVVANGYSSPFVRADLLFCHGSIRGFRRATEGRRIAYGPIELMEAAAGLLARRVAAVSLRAGREWRRMYWTPSRKLRILQNCVDASAFIPAKAGRAAGREVATRVLFVARLGIPKGTDRLHALLDHSAKTGTHLKLVIATPSAEGTAAFAARSDVELLVGVPFGKLPELYRSCDVLYLPSRYEGFEMVTLEALASGTPVVGSDVGGMAELSRLGFPGVTIVDPDDVEAALGAILAAARDWGDPARKELLHRRTESEYGLEAWSGRLAGIMEGRE